MVHVDLEMSTPQILVKYVYTASNYKRLLFDLGIIPFCRCHGSGMKSDWLLSILNLMSQNLTLLSRVANSSFVIR